MKALQYQLGEWKIRDDGKSLLGKKFVIEGKDVIAKVEGSNAHLHARVISLAPLMLDFVKRYENATHALDMGPEHHYFREEAERLLSIARGEP